MKRTVDAMVIACMFVALYINLTDFPEPSRIVHGHLIKLGVEE